MQSKNKFIPTICAAIVSLCSFNLSAASLQVSPISLTFTTGEKAKEIWLTNTSDEPIRAQTRVLNWTQVEGKEQLHLSRDLVASPSITEIKAGDRQLIRVLRMNMQNTGTEQTYRLLVDELPKSNQANQQTGLQLLLQYSIPVFVQTNEITPAKNGLTSLAQVSFHYQNQQLIVKNNGSRHIRLSELTYVNPNGEKIPLINGLVGYVLNGQTMQWHVPANAQMQPKGQFEARINSDGLAQTLSIQ
ncbi:fimbrial biogenesis chaperone [Acinetobacter zhairhuonensis]|uniref:fimbrial biogenesis chaperone n=1 Tax=Acinetobacter sp. A7.4 TaxID=2919921 RepID=UPI001F4F5134|nr:molecular chaperone [Acinetobacter sp. A7.4]MCJ8162284.1 molecular chaperone [Acinetobacter sp. A7.4]